MKDEQIKHMVNRFLAWKLPANFAPDAGISFKAAFNEHTAHPMKHDPSGTNLFDAGQADAMVRHMVEGVPSETAWLVEWPGDRHQPVRWWHPKHGWTIDAGAAIRFARKVDADAYIAGSSMKWAKATEHSWIDGVCPECHGTGERTHPEGGPQYEGQECR